MLLQRGVIGYRIGNFGKFGSKSTRIVNVSLGERGEGGRNACHGRASGLGSGPGSQARSVHVRDVVLRPTTRDGIIKSRCTR